MSDGRAPIAFVRRAAAALGLAAFGVLLLNAWLRLVLCVDRQALGLICAMVVWATTAATWPARSGLRQPHPRKPTLVDRRWLAASGITLLVFVLLDVFLHFRFLLLSIALLLALVHVLGAIGTLFSRTGAQLGRPGPELRMLGFVLALAAFTFVAVTKLSALGAYRLVSRERGVRADPLDSRRDRDRGLSRRSAHASAASRCCARGHPRRLGHVWMARERW